MYLQDHYYNVIYQQHFQMYLVDRYYNLFAHYWHSLYLQDMVVGELYLDLHKNVLVNILHIVLFLLDLYKCLQGIMFVVGFLNHQHNILDLLVYKKIVQVVIGKFLLDMQFLWSVQVILRNNQVKLGSILIGLVVVSMFLLRKELVLFDRYELQKILVVFVSKSLVQV
jgi:hypothetical protein